MKFDLYGFVRCYEVFLKERTYISNRLAIYMGIIKPVANLIKYGTARLLPQIDPEVMRPIFERHIRKLSFYSPEDHLEVTKRTRKSLSFNYVPNPRRFVWFSGRIYAQVPRESFGDVDAVSYMNLRMLAMQTLNHDEREELFNAISGIVESAGIEKVIPGNPGVDAEDAQRVRGFKGHRRLEHLHYGLGVYV